MVSSFILAVSSDLIISSRLIEQKDGVWQHYIYNKGQGWLATAHRDSSVWIYFFWKRRLFLIRLLGSVFLGVKLMLLLLTFLPQNIQDCINAGSIVAKWFSAFTTILHSARVIAGHDMNAIITNTRHVDRHTRRGCIVFLSF